MLPIIIIFILGLDRLTKHLVSQKLYLGQSIPVIQDIFHITLTHNRGAAFGILRNQLPLFVIVALIAIVMILLGFRNNQYRLRPFYRLSLALILAGAAGNLIDRLTLGYVIDFLDLRVWPVFNIADSAISTGAVLLSFSLLKPKKKNVSGNL